MEPRSRISDVDSESWLGEKVPSVAAYNHLQHCIMLGCGCGTARLERQLLVHMCENVSSERRVLRALLLDGVCFLSV